MLTAVFSALKVLTQMSLPIAMQFYPHVECLMIIVAWDHLAFSFYP